ncbi:hypothetical protein P7K49_028754 [Saguinus oedipus]|uniref:Uncharacterized protein n=1 Tax=Saguinus oedipus TaxID=9490 RepID=A0ABQ9U5W8_SAGOE|nr:hypothetical protein P7K49_028754 [Saguinus oedipus]
MQNHLGHLDREVERLERRAPAGTENTHPCKKSRPRVEAYPSGRPAAGPRPPSASPNGNLPTQFGCAAERSCEGLKLKRSPRGAESGGPEEGGARERTKGSASEARDDGTHQAGAEGPLRPCSLCLVLPGLPGVVAAPRNSAGAGREALAFAWNSGCERRGPAGGGGGGGRGPAACGSEAAWLGLLRGGVACAPDRAALPAFDEVAAAPSLGPSQVPARADSAFQTVGMRPGPGSSPRAASFPTGPFCGSQRPFETRSHEFLQRG